MVRVKRGNVARKSRKKILYLAKGFRGSHSKIFRIANEQVMKALKYSYVVRKQEFRKLWITRLNAATRVTWNLSYSRFMQKINQAQIKINRKMLSQLAVIDPVSFQKLKQEI